LSRQWTIDDLLELPDDGNRYELVDGALRMSPGPTWRHNNAASGLVRQLEPALPRRGRHHLLLAGEVRSHVADHRAGVA
ncbi:MAG: Uma2 family endonuclease, partial [Nocardioidaceae bacterium]|nr:Uma2 family endonuclease [Nocardioidaceae bacterium]